MSKHILIIEDDREISELISRFLTLENFQVHQAFNGIEGLEYVKKNTYQLVVLDIMLPIKSGYEVLTEIRKVSFVPILILSAKDSEIDKITGLKLGADDYVTKPFSIHELIARVQALLRRTSQMKENQEELIFQYKKLIISFHQRKVCVNEVNIELTAKEFDLLSFLATNQGRVFTKKQIYQAVWKEEYAYDDNNIMVTIRRLRMKIEPDPQNPIYIQTVWGVGYKFSKED